MPDIPEHLQRLFDGYDGGEPPTKAQLEALISSAPQHIKDRLAEREKELNWVLIENDGALFRGPSRGNPMEVWSASERKFIPYAHADRPRDVSWGTVVTQEQAREFM